MNQTTTFRRLWWKTAIRYFGLVVIFLLNTSLVMANVKLWLAHKMGIEEQLVSYISALLVSAFFLVPLIFEIESAKVKPDALTVKTLLWQTTIRWSDIQGVSSPQFLLFVILRTKRCFYLINKKDIPGYADLLQLIHSRLSVGSS